jgi:hypothetical protein
MFYVVFFFANNIFCWKKTVFMCFFLILEKKLKVGGGGGGAKLCWLGPLSSVLFAERTLLLDQLLKYRFIYLYFGIFVKCDELTKRIYNRSTAWWWSNNTLDTALEKCSVSKLLRLISSHSWYSFIARWNLWSFRWRSDLPSALSTCSKRRLEYVSNACRRSCNEEQC